MLIASDRHTPADLAAWAEYEAADAAHAPSVMLRKSVAAMAYLRLFAASGPVGYCGVSWGKDSVVVADIVRRYREAGGELVPLVWVRVEPISNPDCEAVRDAFLGSWPEAEYHEIAVRCGRDAAGWHATGTLEDGFRQACERFGDRRVSGVRADESGARTLSARTHGVATRLSCRPILQWSAADVYAYHHARGLPTHPAYAMLGGGRWPRDRLRVSSLGGRRGDGIGRRQWETEYYGDVLRRLESKPTHEAAAVCPNANGR